MAAFETEVVAAELRRTSGGTVVQEAVGVGFFERVDESHGNEARSSLHTCAGSDAVAPASQLEPPGSPPKPLSPQAFPSSAMSYSAAASVGSMATNQAMATEITEVFTPKTASVPAPVETPSTVPQPTPFTPDGLGAAISPVGVTDTPVLPDKAAKEANALYSKTAEAVDSSGNDTDLKGADVGSPTIPALAESPSLKDLPKVAANAAKQAGKAYIEAGIEARSTVNSLKAAFLGKPGPPITLTVDRIVTVVFFVFLAFQLLLLLIFMPSFFRLAYCLLRGLLIGLGLSFLFYYNKKAKTEANEVLSVNLGMKGLCLVAGALPSWIKMSHTEKLEWLNRLIVEVWPYVDKGMCTMIKEITAQVMPGVLKTLPAGLGGIVKSIGFKHLTFGDAPFRVESMWVGADEKDSLVLELSVKWCGDPNITLAIEIPGGQKLCPRVMDISFVAQVRVMLHPLVPRIPGFVALMATVPKPPLIKYRLDFGKAMGGSMAPAAVTPVINYFMRDIITKMLVWPQRLVVPVLQETEQDKVEIQRLMRRHRGVLRICVESAKELKPDSWGSNDVMVELTTDSEHYETTSIRRAKPVLDADGKVMEHIGESVSWNDYIFLLIQEPKNQLMWLELFDIDRLRPSKLLTGQVSQVVNGRQLMGRSLIKLAEVCRAGKEGLGITAHLGRGEWGSPGGPGKGRGKVKLSLTYWPFESFTKYDTENAMMGIVTVRVLKVWGLATVGDKLSAFVRITSSARGSREKRTTTKTWTRRGHVLMLRREMDRLKIARERDEREGRSKEAERKAKFIEALNDAVQGNNKRARLTVDLDYTLDSHAMHAVYHVKLTDYVKIKVITSSLLGEECLGRLDVPVSDIVTAYDFNPITGQREHGLHRKRWEEYNPEQPDRTIDQMERGLVLEEGEGARIWLEMRWVPCIQVRRGQVRNEVWLPT
ncbi:hypothetical protein Vretimale_10731 [Volvox reticuliferus]|uniref:SMP-LTD domain-containing protein n=1 Tax=Volvox reticuliferus TaxID=1737510 RepID=A0A8J4LRD0_9CHLO|nr:hypothetical protein Vretifemale_13832 [Volvox reticuliferus]GIM06487.1 hypothetical protein Vretimale_10731 [Volvox reticuliferus]